MKRLFMVTIIFSLTVTSCGYIAARFRDWYNIRTEYKTNNDNININNLVDIFQEINKSPNAEYEHIGIKTYRKYSAPYTLQIIFTFYEHNNIGKIMFDSCNIVVKGNEIYLLKLDDISVSLARYYYKTKSGSSSTNNPKEEKLFQEKQILIIDEYDDIFIEGYYINFHNLPIDINMNTASIKFDISILLKNGEIIETKKETMYIQEITEEHLGFPLKLNRK